MQTMQPETLIANHPKLFHAADARAWPSIQAHGLLPTSAILDRYGAPGEVMEAALSGIRRRTIVVESTDGHTAVVRDQAPLKFLDRVLTSDTTVQEYLDLLNGRCYFWATKERLDRIVNGRLYRRTPQVILTIDTRSLVEKYGHVVELSPYNSGSAHVPNAPQRGRGTFLPVHEYDYEDWRRRRGKASEAVVEVTVPGPVPDILAHIIDVHVIDGQGTKN